MSRTSSQEKSAAAEEGRRARSRITGTPAPRIASQTRDHLDHLARRRGRARRGRPPRTQAATAAAVPMSRSPGGQRRARLPMKLLREGPTSTGRSSARKLGQAAQRPRGCGPASLAKPMPGVDDAAARAATPARSAAARAPPRARPPPRPSRRRSRAARCIVVEVAAQVHHAPPARRARPRAAPWPGRSGSRSRRSRGRPPRRGRPRATSAFVVSTESGPAPARREGLGSRAPRAGAPRPRPPEPLRRAGSTRRPRRRCRRPPRRARGRGATAASASGEAPAVGERVGGHVQDAHDQRALAEDAPRAPRRGRR